MMNELTSKYVRFMTGLGSRKQELPQFSDGSEEGNLIARSFCFRGIQARRVPQFDDGGEEEDLI
jgi:hypothetical protein